MYDDRLGAPDSKSEKLRSMYERLWAEYERTAQGYHKATVADDPGKWTFDEWYIKDVQAARIAPYSTGCDCPTCTDARKRHVAGQRAYSYSQFVQDLRLGKDLGSA